MSKRTGKLIVVDGTDGSGKATQVERLTSELIRFGFDPVSVSFPRYGKTSSELIEQYLNGQLTFSNAYGPALLYAYDRLAAKAEIQNYLSQGKIVVIDRYVMSNCAYQGSKIDDPDAQLRFIKWVFNLEYDLLALPKPDLNIILYVEPSVSKRLLAARSKAAVIKNDIHEASDSHQQRAAQLYKYLARIAPNSYLIDCMAGGQLQSVDKIAAQVWNKVYRQVLNNPIL